MTPTPMTKADRDQLLQLVRKRERVMRHVAGERSAALLAEFDAQSAKIYHWDEDAVWAKVQAKAQDAIEEAQLEIAARCKQLGIPVEFSPTLSLAWHGRGHNAVADRRGELRRAAKSKIDAIEKDALAKIERMGLDAQTAIIADGLQSPAAKAFLEKMPPIEKLMPSINVKEIQQLVETKREQQKQLGYFH